MARSTFFVALPYHRAADGSLVLGEVSWCATSAQAAQEAERLAEVTGGAMAFSRGVDLELGTFDAMAIIKSVGAAPEALDIAGALSDSCRRVCPASWRMSNDQS